MNIMKCVVVLLMSIPVKGIPLGNSGDRYIYIFNGTPEKVTVKGPTKSTNKRAVPVAIDPGKVLIKELSGEGAIGSALDLTYIGNDSGQIKKFSRNYDGKQVVYVIDWDEPTVSYITSQTNQMTENSF